MITPLAAAASLVVGIANDVDNDPAGEFLTAWQLRLEIVADAAATGSLEFDDGSRPAGYVFDGTGSFGLSVSNSGDRLFGLDLNLPDTGGVQVPAAPGANLLAITFAPSADAVGRFGIFALAGPTNSEWTDAANPVRQRRTFANVPDGGGPVRIADVLVMLPGDFNLDGTVNAADYVVWRNNTSGEFTAADYQVWREHFGESFSDAGSGTIAVNVPEPAAIVLLILGVLAGTLWQTLRRGTNL